MIDFHFKTRSRKPLEEKFEIRLPGFQELEYEDTFRYEVNVLRSQDQALVDRSVIFDLQSPTLDSAMAPLEFTMRFEPLKPYKAQAELVIYKSSGGRWKFNAVFEATEPQVDDIININSPLQKTSSVSFKLTNHIKQHSPFQAYFAEGSAPEFGI